MLFPGRWQGTTSWSWRSFWLLVFLSSVLLLPWLNFPLFEPDEGRYAQIPFEMLSRGDWIVPTLQGEPYLDKPPLFYWAVLLAYAVFGVADWSARLVPALAVQGTVLLVYGLGRRLVGDRAAFRGAVALLIAPAFIGMGRLLVLDGLLALWVTAALLSAFLAVQTPRLHRGWWVLAAAASGLGVLTKGPIAVVLLIPPLAAQRWLGGAVAAIGWRGWGGFAGIILAVSAPWYLAILVREPEFGGYFFWKHNVLRFLQPFDHIRPVWYYLPILLGGLLPLTLLLVPGMRWLLSGREDTARQRCPAVSYLLLAAGWCVLFFSLSGSKLPTYVLPAVPPACLALGAYLARGGWRRSPWPGVTAAATYAMLLAGNVWLVPAIAWERSPLNTPPEVTQWCRDPTM
ncbi:MAG: glycosyltransferase family 39 protein, partial [Gemmataceae bacterium]|nr:glycosyltransferase family 39 protein [Gemmataceae bacterium]